MPEPARAGKIQGKWAQGLWGPPPGTHSCTLRPPAFSGVLSTPRPLARVLAHVTLYRSQAVGGGSPCTGV